MNKNMKRLSVILFLGLFLFISSDYAMSDQSIDARVTTATDGCDKASNFFWKGRFGTQNNQARQSYLKAIELCPGYIRPYELVGNLYRKQDQIDKAISYFTKAAELGTTNYKLYYLLASLLFKKGVLDQANQYIKKSLSIRRDYPKAVELNNKIEKARDSEGPKIILYEPSARRGIKIIHKYESLTVRGIAIDKSGVAWIKINQSETSFDENGNFLKDIPILMGNNTILVEAEDQVELSASRS